jgi:hypothetical protein
MMEYDEPNRVSHHYVKVFTDNWRADSRPQLVFSPIAREQIYIKMETESIKKWSEAEGCLIPRKKGRNCGWMFRHFVQ